MNEPFGTTAISGQTSHSLKLSFGSNDCSISGVSGWMRFSGKNCRGAREGGVDLIEGIDGDENGLAVRHRQSDEDDGKRHQDERRDDLADHGITRSAG